MLPVMPVGEFIGDLHQFHSRDLEAATFKSRDDVPDECPLYRVGLE